MRLHDVRNPDEEFVTARAECVECQEPIEQICTPFDVEGKTYPPVYTWKHLDGRVLCERPRMATPKDGSIVKAQP